MRKGRIPKQTRVELVRELKNTKKWLRRAEDIFAGIVEGQISSSECRSVAWTYLLVKKLITRSGEVRKGK